MDREKLRERIENLPKFEKRDIQIKTSANGEEEFVAGFHKAICEVGDKDSYAYAFCNTNYSLLQFEDLFNPILNSVEGNVDGYVTHYGGFAMMKFFPEMEELREGDSKFGLVAMNSVDMSSSIIVKFCVRHQGQTISIPPKVAGLKKQHSGDVKNLTKDYISMIGKVKKAWGKIIEEFPKYNIVRDLEKADDTINPIEFGTVIEELKIGKRAAKILDEKMTKRLNNGGSFTLWDAFVMILTEISQKTYKSEVHKERKIDNICQAVFDYAMLLSI